MNKPTIAENEEQKELEYAEAVRNLVTQNGRASKLPVKNGHWSDPEKKGNCDWILDPEAIFRWKKGEISYSALQEKYSQFDLSKISFVNNEPMFDNFQDQKIGTLKIDDFSGERNGKNGTYHQATMLTAKKLHMSPRQVYVYMKENELTWHECCDRKTVIAIPTDINAVIPHTGGIGVHKEYVRIKGKYKNLGKDSIYTREVAKELAKISKLEEDVKRIREARKAKEAHQADNKLEDEWANLNRKDENKFNPLEDELEDLYKPPEKEMDPMEDEWAELGSQKENEVNPLEDELKDLYKLPEKEIDSMENEWENLEKYGSSESKMNDRAEAPFEAKKHSASKAGEKSYSECYLQGRL